MSSTQHVIKDRRQNTRLIRQLAVLFPCVQFTLYGINWVVIYVPMYDNEYYTLCYRITSEEKKYFPENKYPMIDYDNETQI